jgi:hypothetical protein
VTAGKTELGVIPVWVPRLSVRFSAVYIAFLLTEFIEGAGKISFGSSTRVTSSKTVVHCV